MENTEGMPLTNALSDNPNKLLPVQKQRRDELEKIIYTNFLAFYEVGCALKEIRTLKLYRETHDTFELYCREMWDMAKRHAYKLIAASKVIDVLSTTGGQSEKVPHGAHSENESSNPDDEKVPNWALSEIIPINEAQTRPLTRLETPEQQIEAWSKAVETAPNGRITAKHVNDVVSSLVTTKSKERVGKVKKGLFAEETVSFEFKKAISIFLDAIQEERKLGWKKTHRKDAMRYVNEFLRMIERES